jgi:acetoacetate decarboxylase
LRGQRGGGRAAIAGRHARCRRSALTAASPSYPRGPYRFVDREYLIITYETDADAIRDALPEVLQPDGSNMVLYEFIRMPDSAGFGDYTESGVVIPARLGDEHVNFTAQMNLDDEPPIAGGREIWGFPKKHAKPRLAVVQDKLTGTLEYAGIQVAVGTHGLQASTSAL